jgi:hypothetical protein
MSASYPIQLSQLIKTPTPKAIVSEVRKTFCYHYPRKYFIDIHKNYTLIKKLFEGGFPGYKPCNTHYHDFMHTITILLSAVRILDGYNISNPPLPVHLAVDLLNAAFFHDTGYIQEEWDQEVSGAKYTTTHVKRSIDFLGKHHTTFIVDPEQLQALNNIILCTDLTVNVDTIPFASAEEKLVGYMLGTSDLLAQMSDRAYLEKLLFLYYEFKDGGIEGFDFEFDIIRKTTVFYEFMKKRLNETCGGVYRYAQTHFEKRFKLDQNLYMEAIERHMAYLYKIIDDDSTNFRHKLRRGAWIHTYRG